jgi:type II pantothenate kinase
MSNQIRGASTADGATVGADAGATLCKLVLPAPTGLHTVKFPSADLDSVRACLSDWRPRRVVATGGGAARLARELAHFEVKTVPEFAAWARGAPLLASRIGLALPERYLVAVVGTGTSVLALDPSGAKRIGGSALGGGTLLGLGRLLLGVDSFDEICALAARGDRRRVDLLVSDIYPGGEIALPGELNAASFAKLASREPQDIAHALVGMLGENIGLIAGNLARSFGAGAVLYCGSTLLHNAELQEILRWVTAMHGATAHFPEHGAFCGALGAVAMLDGDGAHAY